jgi:recombination protein RecA
MVDLNEVMEITNRQCGKGTMFKGSGLARDPSRIPFGIFSVDYATGGGIPVWGTTGLWGPEAGGKSSMAANVMATSQKICWTCFNYLPFCSCSLPSLEMQTVWEDVEGTMDRGWVEAIGAHPEKYHVALADYGEMYANIADNALKADDCGLLIVDSLASLTPEKEMTAAAEDDFYALQARLIGRMVRRLKQRLIIERKREHPCSLILLNQMRSKIGVTFGSPETMSGGHALKHEFSLLLRCVKKAMTDLDKKMFVDKDKEHAVRHAFAIKKEKILTLAGSGEFVRVKDDMPEEGLVKGQIYDMPKVLNYAKEYGLIQKTGDSKSPWKFLNIKAKRLEQIKELWLSDPGKYYFPTQSGIVNAAKERLLEQAEEAARSRGEEG